MKKVHKEKEHNAAKAEQKKKQQKVQSLFVTRRAEQVNIQVQQPNAISGQISHKAVNSNLIPAVHGSQPAYAQRSELMYDQFQESLRQTGDLNHPDTLKKEMDYKRSLSLNELRQYQDIRPQGIMAKSGFPAVTQNNHVKGNDPISDNINLYSAEQVPPKVAGPQNDPDVRTITLEKGQQFNNKLIQTDDDLNRFAEFKMGITRPLDWKPKYTDSQVQQIVANGGTVRYTLSAIANDVKKEIEALPADKKQLLSGDYYGTDYIQKSRILDLLKKCQQKIWQIIKAKSLKNQAIRQILKNHSKPILQCVTKPAKIKSNSKL